KSRRPISSVPRTAPWMTIPAAPIVSRWRSMSLPVTACAVDPPASTGSTSPARTYSNARWSTRLSPWRTRTVTAVPAIRPPRWNGRSRPVPTRPCMLSLRIAVGRRRSTPRMSSGTWGAEGNLRLPMGAGWVMRVSSEGWRRRQRVADYPLVDLLQVAVLPVEEDEGVQPLQEIHIALAHADGVPVARRDGYLDFILAGETL